MDALYCKTQLAWVVNNAKRAQDAIANGDSTSAEFDLDAAERAIANVRANMGGRSKEKPPIVVSAVFPPIPTRQHDFCAFRDGEEERGHYGYGPTREMAVADLLTIEDGE